MKKILTLLLAIALCCLPGCQAFVRFPKPKDTNLEFWIAENVSKVDFSTYQEKYRYGFMGSGRLYYGAGYTPTVDEEGKQVDPEYCVVYTVAPYPDVISRKCHITGIVITDPEIVFYGISLRSTAEEFEKRIQEQGFSLAESSGEYRFAVKGKYSISFSQTQISISVRVTNKTGIQF